jgi:polygalacturonase
VVPSPEDPNVLYFKGGSTYNVGTLELEDNQTLYIEGGAVLQGVIRTTNKDKVKVCGRGIFDGSLEPRSEEQRRHFVVFEGCTDLYLEGIILIEPPFWMLVLGACNGVKINNVKEIGQVVSSDGVDIVGSKNVVIDGMFIRNNDDCIAVKSIDFTGDPENAKISWANDVDNILVKNCVFYTSHENGGNALEIGFELCTDYIQNITFENNDVIAVHGFGGIFTIHAGDRATVRNVKYENIRVEHFFDKLVDLRIVHSPMWNKDNQKGQIRNVYFKDIYANVQVFNDGYTNSLIGGYSPDNTVEGVVFENFCLSGKKAENIDDIWLHTKHAFGIEFK